MADIKRFDYTNDIHGMEESQDGVWVKYDDILPAIQRAYTEGIKTGVGINEKLSVPFPDRSNFPNC